MLLSIILFTAASLLMQIGDGEAIRCHSCFDCAYDKSKSVACGEDAKGCVTIKSTDGQTIRRDCFTNRLAKVCDIKKLSEGLCLFCSHDDCNYQKIEPLICRDCDWTRDVTCPTQKRCFIPFGTVPVQCYILYNKDRGFRYGCLEEAPLDVVQLMKRDEYRFTYHLCDSHNCNAEMTFLNADHLFDTGRNCQRCVEVSDGLYCSIRVCGQLPTNSIFATFCFLDKRTQLNIELSGCVSEQFPNELRSRAIAKKLILCSSNLCNDNIVLQPSIECDGPNNLIAYGWRADDRCVGYTGELPFMPEVRAVDCCMNDNS